MQQARRAQRNQKAGWGRGRGPRELAQLGLGWGGPPAGVIGWGDKGSVAGSAPGWLWLRHCTQRAEQGHGGVRFDAGSGVCGWEGKNFEAKSRGILYGGHTGLAALKMVKRVL